MGNINYLPLLMFAFVYSCCCRLPSMTSILSLAGLLSRSDKLSLYSLYLQQERLYTAKYSCHDQQYQY